MRLEKRLIVYFSQVESKQASIDRKQKLKKFKACFSANDCYPNARNIWYIEFSQRFSMGQE